jgi:hypothetical protein
MRSSESFADKLMTLLRDRKEDEGRRISALELARKEVDGAVSYWRFVVLMCVAIRSLR